ncbi:MAG TPA: YceI family protein [Anaeromyxobacteraceae bacterium]|jgi:hypothetical protein|nr:YceI family protein [Anaeromyxobacteraceae bacterium]
MPTFGPDRASCEILTFKEGLLSSVAHDLLLRITRFELTVAETPPSVRAWFESASLEVVAAMRGGRPAPGVLREPDLKEIQRTALSEVLQASRYPRVTFASTSVKARADGYEVQGELTLCGTARAISFVVRRSGAGLAAEVPLRQPDFGIRPYTAMLGALKVKPEVVIRLSVPAP